MNDAAGQAELQYWGCWGFCIGTVLGSTCASKLPIRSLIYHAFRANHYSSSFYNKFERMVLDAGDSTRIYALQEQQTTRHLSCGDATVISESLADWFAYRDIVKTFADYYFLRERAAHASSIVQSPQAQHILFFSSETPLIPLLLSLRQFPQL
ncbi:hypothetical protein IW261DRAFT_1573920 [Armillaria novae-zelandiae]|uniref:Uncharacterized protein n=1 Tax=Armillaria novae-zelandiae TaxID=153914 RepID=A0AA39TVF7_9AGAR|nr:hypothetical protein IW261DRAFT_1573920 [Armillaria novae-zelandiae]